MLLQLSEGQREWLKPNEPASQEYHHIHELESLKGQPASISVALVIVAKDSGINEC